MFIEKFVEFFDNLIDYYDDVHYLYIMKVGDVNEEVPIHELCAANSTYEKTFEPDMVLHLGDGEADWFTLKQVKQYRKILESKKDSYFRNELNLDHLKDLYSKKTEENQRPSQSGLKSKMDLFYQELNDYKKTNCAADPAISAVPAGFFLKYQRVHDL